MKILAYILSGLSLLMSVLLLIKLKVLNGLFFAKLFASALSPVWAVVGVIGAVLGWAYQTVWAIPLGIGGAGMMAFYIWRCTWGHKGFEEAFGPGWADMIPPEQSRLMLQKRWMGFLKMKASPEPVWERDVAFWTIPDTERELLCDIWRPAKGNISGLAIVFFHGGGWFSMNKDFLTRPFFNHLVAQGHTVMDVAYRLCPETDIYGIMGDVKRAIAWMKANASQYGVNPEKVVACGSSVGGHLALLAAYTSQGSELTPEDVKDVDLSVCGVVSYYGPTDLLVGYEAWQTTNPFMDLPAVPIGTKLDPKMQTRYAGRMDILLGCLPANSPDIYQLVSPITHVQPGCPPTLLLQGDKDILVDVDITRRFYAKLLEAGVPAVYVEFPWTDHMFDLLFPPINPAAHSALYDVDRFLGLLLNQE